MATNAQTKRQEKAILRRRRSIYNMYARAYFDGDVSGLQNVANKIVEYNQRYPQYPILQDNLDKSIRGRIRQRTGAFHGLTLNPRLRDLLIEQAERYGDPTIFD